MSDTMSPMPTVPGVNPLTANMMGSIPGLGFGSTGQANPAQAAQAQTQAPVPSQVNPQNLQMFGQASQLPPNNIQQLMQQLQIWQQMNGMNGVNPLGQAGGLQSATGTQAGAPMQPGVSQGLPPSLFPPAGAIGESQGNPLTQGNQSIGLGYGRSIEPIPNNTPNNGYLLPIPNAGPTMMNNYLGQGSRFPRT